MILKYCVFIFIGFFLLIKGADYLIDGASAIARKMYVSDFLIGLTIVSIGTSLPELVVSVNSALKGYQDITIGNVIGSNLANLLLILGIVSIIKPISIHKNTQNFEFPICLLATMLLAMLCIWNNGVTRIEASYLLILFTIFIIYTIFATKNKENKISNNEHKNNKVWSSILFIIIGIVALKIGGDFTINNATDLARYIGLSEKLISITIIAIGTSLPELVTSIIAALKGSSDIAVGNIIGSNIFNILLIVSTSALVKPIVYNVSYNIDIIVLLFATLLLTLFPLFPPKNKMERNEGVLFVFIYALYIIVSFK